jgi:putative RecB family exonuclease
MSEGRRSVPVMTAIATASTLLTDAAQAGGAPLDVPVELPVEALDAPRPGRASSLSPSRASDFMSCPLRYRFRVIDRLPEPPSPAATRGTLVHAVLERLFDLAPAERTVEAAVELVGPAWESLLDEEPERAGLFDDAAGLQTWLGSARGLLDAYFALEDPQRLAPAARELLVEHELASGLHLRGIVDRLDESPTGLLRVVDYKTGSAPSVDFEARALFQLKFYALVLWRTRGVVPAELVLLYLGGSAQRLRYQPDADELARFERTLEALWAAIQRAHETGDWRPRQSKLCDWCDHQALCPAFGGTPPPLPVDVTLGAPEAEGRTRTAERPTAPGSEPSAA